MKELDLLRNFFVFWIVVIVVVHLRLHPLRERDVFLPVFLGVHLHLFLQSDTFLHQASSMAYHGEVPICYLKWDKASHLHSILWQNLSGYGSRCLIFQVIFGLFTRSLSHISWSRPRNSKIARATSIIESSLLLVQQILLIQKFRSPYVSFPKWRRIGLQPHPILNDRLKLLVTKSITHFIVTLYYFDRISPFVKENSRILSMKSEKEEPHGSSFFI